MKSEENKKGGKTRMKGANLGRSSASEYLTFMMAKGEGGVVGVYSDEDVWLTQRMMG